MTNPKLPSPRATGRPATIVAGIPEEYVSPDHLAFLFARQRPRSTPVGLRFLEVPHRRLIRRHVSSRPQHPNMKTAKDCTLGCVKAGSKYVLYDSSTKNVYEVDDQKKAEQFAGQKVTVTGNLDAASNAIHVANIKTGS